MNDHPKNDHDNIREETRRLTDRLQTLRDEIKVKAHLAQMDADDAWDRTTQQIDRTVADLERAAQGWETASDEAKVRLHLGLMEARERAELIQERIGGVWDQLEAAGEGLERKIDLAELRAHLALMEAEDFYRDKRQKVEELIRESRDKATSSLEHGLRAVSDGLDKFIKKL